LDEDIARYPQTRSDFPLLDALYNLSLSELKKDTRADGALSAGAEWDGVWTRDVSYSALLSLAAIEPQAVKTSLLRKVKRDRIVQDTGTGGAWPVSTDRVTWALAAWEVYLVTGDRQWLEKSYLVIRNSVVDDELVAMDSTSGLVHGESSFMDWREQTYPRWMQPVDIYSSEDLGTNAVFYRTYRILGLMAQQLDQPAQQWNSKADKIQSSMNCLLWLRGRGYYGQYLYGRMWQTLSPRPDALGEALSILFDIPELKRQDEILRSQPLMPYGIPTVYPETPNIPPYHNRSVWPFVQAFWNLAAAKRRNQAALIYGLASIDRDSALFLTNKENFVADTGSQVGTAINSDRQLWSVAGNLAMVYRVLFGMEFGLDGLHIHPVIPQSLGGTRTLTNFHYRESVLSLQVTGFGSHVRRVKLDGQLVPALIPANLVGNHHIAIEMDGRPFPPEKLNSVERMIAPETPAPSLDGHTLTWNAVEGATGYRIYRNGHAIQETSRTSFVVSGDVALKQYQVAALKSPGVASFLSFPVVVGGQQITIPAAGAGTNRKTPAFVNVEQTGDTGIAVAGAVPRSGTYSLSFQYANGSGPINTDNKCAIRTLFIDGQEIGPIILPQRGQDDWNNWGSSSSQVTQLSAGTHRFELRFLPQDLNMNGEINSARIASIVLIPLN
jgi:hypothetical protein